MASFTDAITQFNPYVAQLPVDAMVKVGMQKQAQYEEGYKKIQGEIDRVVGLDIMRDVDKDYLQSKLDELGGNLRTFAAGDFSNFQLVNSVGGMARQVGKDEVVQTSVASTALYRKQKQLQESLRKEGKAGESNDWLFNQDVNKWYNDPKAGASFTGNYRPYTNWRKNSLEVIKQLTGDSTITDDAFTTDAKGNLVIADAIVRKKIAGISPEKVQQALLVGLTPDDFKQMEIDGRYNYSNIDDKTFVSRVNESYDDKINFFKNQKTTLENAKSSTNSVVEKNKLNDQIVSLDKTINNLTKEYSSITETFNNGDIESAKARLFTTDSLNNFSKTFAHTETSLTYENSPLAQAQQFRETKEIDWKKYIMTYNQNAQFHKEDREDKKLDREQKKRENDLKQKELEGYGGLPGPVDPSLVPKVNLNTVTDEVNKGTIALDKADNTFLAQKGKDKAWLDSQRDAWEKRPGSVESDVAFHFNSTEAFRRKVEGDKQVIIDANKAATAKYGTIDDLIPKDARSIDYFSKGGNYRYSPKDFVEFNNLIGNYESLVSTGGGSPSFGMAPSGGGVVKFDDAKAKSELSDKMYNLYQMYKQSRTGKSDLLGSGGKTLVSNLKFYKDNVNVPYGKKLNAIMDETNTIVTERLTTSQGVSYGIPTATAAQQTSIANVLNQFADLADKTGGSLANSPNWNTETARKLALEEKPNYSFTVVEGTERQPKAYMMSVSGKAGTVSARVTPEQKTYVFGQMYEASPAVQALRPYQEQMRKTGGYSTAPIPNAPTTQSNSWMSAIDFPNVATYGVKGNVVNVGKDPRTGKDLYTIKLAIYDPMLQDWKEDLSFPRKGLLIDEAVVPAMQSLNDATLYELLNEKPATSKDIKLLQTAAKKPL